MILIFDIDGTLTEPRKSIEKDMLVVLTAISEKYPVFLVSGSDYGKIQEQIPENFLNNRARATFACSGNDIWMHGQKIKSSDWNIPESLENYLYKTIEKSEYPIKTGNHIEKRTGTVNFSFVGRNATHDQREEYFKWDCAWNQRKTLVSFINDNWPDVDAQIGGKISIDIFPKGKDKSQILEHFSESDYNKIVFFGDRIYPGGNDFTLAKLIEKNGGNIVPVTTIADTRKYLEAKFYK